MTADEIDRDKWVWTLPAARSKNKSPRVTPLVGAARSIIEARIAERRSSISRRGGRRPHVGECRKRAASSSSSIADRCVQDPRSPAHGRQHDVRDWGSRKTSSAQLSGMATRTGKAARVLIRHYLKSDLIARKAQALAIWDAHLGAIVAGQVPVDNVVPIRA